VGSRHGARLRQQERASRVERCKVGFPPGGLVVRYREHALRSAKRLSRLLQQLIGWAHSETP
jgi:hypothetical protein